MSEVVNALVAFAVIVFIFRWATSGQPCSFSSLPVAHPSPRFARLVRPTLSHNRTRLQAQACHSRDGTPFPSPCPLDPSTHRPIQVDQIHTMFPDIPPYVSPPLAPGTLPHTLDPVTTFASTSCAQAASSSPRTRFSSAGSSSRFVPLPPFFFLLWTRSQCRAASTGLLYSLPPPRRSNRSPTPTDHHTSKHDGRALLRDDHRSPSFPHRALPSRTTGH